MTKRLSTNEKLHDIINGPDDNLQIENIHELEKAARNHLRRSSLYGGGARTRIPKVKKKSAESTSPFMLSNPSFKVDELETSAVPPGAHSDQYRIVQYPTEKSLNDPDRIFFTTTSQTEGIRFMPQPPWYFGYENKTTPSDNSAVMAAGRYGYRGSRDIQQFHTKPTNAPNRTTTPYTPAFLKTDNFVNEYAPPIVAAKFQSVNGLESPKLWPETTEFATGYPLKRSSSAASYNRQTTVAETASMRTRKSAEEVIPKVPESLQRTMDRVKCERDVLQDYVAQETQGTIHSLTQYEQLKITADWSDRVSKTANSTLRSTLQRQIPPYVPHTLSDPTDRMRYSGSTALIVHSQSTDEMKFRIQLQNTSSSKPYQLKWKLSINHFHNMLSRLKREHTIPSFLQEIASKLRVCGVMTGTPTMIRRSDFIKSLSKTKAFSDIPMKDLSLFFSAFDAGKKHVIRYVEVLATFYIFDNPKFTALEKLSSLWRVYEQYGNDIPPMEMCLNILLSCCGSDYELESMFHLYKEQFCPECYRLSIVNHVPEESISELERFPIAFHAANSPGRIPSSPALLRRASTASNPLTNSLPSLLSTTNRSSEEKNPSSPGSNAKKDVAVQPPYNICDSVMNHKLFLKALTRCPEVVNCFDLQLESRLIQCYGKDNRHDLPDALNASDDENKDYSWIIAHTRKSSPKQVEKPNIYVKPLIPQTNIFQR